MFLRERARDKTESLSVILRTQALLCGAEIGLWLVSNGIRARGKGEKIRVSFEFSAEKELETPVTYNYGVQSLIYKHIDEKLAAFLHDKGYLLGKRRFKLFTFSRIQGKARFLKHKKSFAFKSPVKIVVSSPVGTFVESLAENFVRTPEIPLFGQTASLESINVCALSRFDTDTTVVMLSTVTMHGTLPTPNGKKNHAIMRHLKENSRGY